jgi:hypothetical protein
LLRVGADQRRGGEIGLRMRLGMDDLVATHTGREQLAAEGVQAISVSGRFVEVTRAAGTPAA